MVSQALLNFILSFHNCNRVLDEIETVLADVITYKTFFKNNGGDQYEL